MGIIIGIMIGWTFIAYILILAGSKSKTEEERRYEDEEQMEWIKNNVRVVRMVIDERMQKSIDKAVIKSMFRMLYLRNLVDKEEYEKLLECTDKKFEDNYYIH